MLFGYITDYNYHPAIMNLRSQTTIAAVKVLPGTVQYKRRVARGPSQFFATQHRLVYRSIDSRLRMRQPRARQVIRQKRSECPALLRSLCVTPGPVLRGSAWHTSGSVLLAVRLSGDPLPFLSVLYRRDTTPSRRTLDRVHRSASARLLRLPHSPRRHSIRWFLRRREQCSARDQRRMTSFRPKTVLRGNDRFRATRARSSSVARRITPGLHEHFARAARAAFTACRNATRRTVLVAACSALVNLRGKLSNQEIQNVKIPRV